MPIFQKSIVDKYLDTLDAGVLDKAYDSYKEVYSAQKIQRIKKLKEEQYQGGFLKDIFGSVLGYTIDPEEGYNIELEKKNETNSKKADGAIVQDEKVLGVIELKSNTTKNLESIKDQAFGYKNNHKGCKYVISSNFHKLRFYVDDATEYEEFDLYNLDKETFKKFYLYLRKEGLLDKNIPKLLKEETKFHEENISKQLYKDYSAFKNKFFENIVKNNPQYDKLLLFKKSQKFLDRILFVLFAEDKELIPTNAISKIVESWTFADDLHYKPLYALFTILFEHLNVGHTYKSGYEIPAYNGGLFAPDEVLDNLKVDDEILKDDLLTLSKYDFNTDVDVNILGHIFEHSLSEIEEIEAEIKGEVADKSKGKRKKDGVFYTPKYITKYIVDNTVGMLCSEKKVVLGLDIDFDVQDYQKSNGFVNAKGKDLFHTLESYKEWLLSLKILDPACGSGAFLNQALTFLIEEHKNIDDLIAELTNTPLRIFDTDKAILENNIFGVDINDESVEIAKLSLWLRTAQKGRKLSNLNNNIKCGNSLIDDPDFAGDKAFNWEKEFPGIFAKGGFDVVIGNPPYVRAELLGEFQEYLKKNYSLHNPSGDLFSYFYEKSFKLLKADTGLFGFISNTFDKTTAGISLREYLQNEITFLEYIDFTEVQIFEGATTYPVIITARNSQNTNNSFQFIKIPKSSQSSVIDIDLHHLVTVEQNTLEKSNWSFKSKSAVKLISKLKEKKTVRELYGKCYYGVKTGLNDAFIIPESYEEGEHLKPIFEGKELSKWTNSKSVQQLIIFKSKWTKQEYGDDISEQIALEKLSNDYPKLLSHILPLTERAKKRYDQGDFFWELRNCAYYELFEKPKIVFPNLQNKNKFSFDETSSYINAPAVILPTNDKFLTAILNSKLVWYFLTNICVVRSGGYIEVKPQYFEQIPIPIINNSAELNKKTNSIIEFTSKIQKVEIKFTKYLQSNFSIEKLSKKLQNWHELGFGDFIKELNKAIKKVGGEKLSKMNEMEWMEVFETKKEEAQGLKSEIDKTDKEIDKMVYELYDLTEEEIQIVENS